ncbi:cell division protein ZapD [Glaciecola sp. KUL10]|uniref:cell division protein ZapD n=1 Tax=Glaciecola sp. (strain KUL10) TaxID=2161813 RepID=UPI000D783538|nr:cell division protein ZapD [Glaciecola sp. KUL10]GBL05634.1 hypothetical protein KUL10_29600 [Glaciecola sp. KUL10]
MSVAIYEFPLSEKVRNYLRLEQLFAQLNSTIESDNKFQTLYFFDVLFTMLDLLERIDLRTDLIRDIDVHEKNLVHWSSHPNIDTQALNKALQQIHDIIAQLKTTKKLGSNLKEDKFLSSIRQRFSIPGGATSFDLPNLFCWINQALENRQAHITQWLSQLSLVQDSISLLLSFLREKGQFKTIVGENAFYQAMVDNKIDMVRVKYDTSSGFYPVLSGNKHRYGIKFMELHPSAGSSGAVAQQVIFELASC